MSTSDKGTMNTITGSPIVTDPALVQSGTIIISHPPVTLAFKRAADGRVHAEYEPGTITEAAQALMVELDRLQAPTLRLPGGVQVNGLDAIRARAEAYVSHGTPGLHAPKDRAVLLAALDAVTALHEPCHMFEYDDVNAVFILDEDGKQVIMATICRGCTPDEVIEDAEDWSYDDSRAVNYPCPTVAAIASALGSPGE